MAEKYPSKYSNGKEVTAAQYIVEILCENKARVTKKDLHYRFWTNKEWAAYYRSQIATAHKLLKVYKPLSIIRALKHEKARYIYSLRAPHLTAIIEQEQKKLEEENTKLTKVFNKEVKSFGQVPSASKNILSKLKELDGE